MVKTRRGGTVPSMWTSAQDRPVWSRSASEWIPWAEARGADNKRAAVAVDMLKSLDNIVSTVLATGTID